MKLCLLDYTWSNRLEPQWGVDETDLNAQPGGAA